MRTLLLGICMLLVASPGWGQFDQCQNPDEILVECLQRQFEGVANQRAADRVGENVAQRPGVATPQLTGASTDFLTPFLMVLGLGDSMSENGNITAKKIFQFGPESDWKGAIGATLLADPDIFAPLKTKLEKDLPEEGRADKIKEIEDSVERYQNFEVDFDLSYEGDWMGLQWGRRTEDYSYLAASAFRASFDSANDTAALNQFFQNVPGDISGATVGTIRAQAMSNPADDDAEAKAAKQKAEQAVAFFNQIIETERKNKNTLSQAAEKSLKTVADLVSNQPQLVINAKYKDFEDVVGPDSVEASLKLEFGLGGNVNGLERWARKGTAVACQNKVRVNDDMVWSLPCMERYLEQDAKDVEKGHRFSLTVTYSDVDPFMFSLPDSDFELKAEASEKLIAKLSYGRWLKGFGLTGDATSDQKARFDLEASYEDVSDDEMRQNRFVATAMLTQKTSACTAASFGFVYANKPEFLGEVDEEVSARFGIRWDNKQLEGCSANGG